MGTLITNNTCSSYCSKNMTKANNQRLNSSTESTAWQVTNVDYKNNADTIDSPKVNDRRWILTTQIQSTSTQESDQRWLTTQVQSTAVRRKVTNVDYQHRYNLLQYVGKWPTLITNTNTIYTAVRWKVTNIDWQNRYNLLQYVGKWPTLSNSFLILNDLDVVQARWWHKRKKRTIYDE